MEQVKTQIAINIRNLKYGFLTLSYKAEKETELVK